MKKWIYWALVALAFGLIFYLSSQPATESGAWSRSLTRWLVVHVSEWYPDAGMHFERVHHLFRKNAHFFIYGLLGILVFNALRLSPLRGWRRAGMSLTICVLVAISDEIHQYFVPGRGAQVRDVIIDGAGAATAIVICWAVSRMRAGWRKRRKAGGLQGQKSNVD
jgi:VanZ family protein